MKNYQPDKSTRTSGFSNQKMKTEVVESKSSVLTKNLSTKCVASSLVKTSLFRNTSKDLCFTKAVNSTSVS